MKYLFMTAIIVGLTATFGMLAVSYMQEQQYVASQYQTSLVNGKITGFIHQNTPEQ